MRTDTKTFAIKYCFAKDNYFALQKSNKHLSLLGAFKDKIYRMNRGRIQAQGGGTEKSEPWALNNDHFKHMGITSLDNLQNQLTNPELILRTNALQQCRNRILTTPGYGVSAQMKKSYYDDIRNRKIRVDIEVNAGVAFIDNPVNDN